MANAASRLFNIIKNTSEETNIKPSEIVTLTVKSINPIIFQRDDRLEIADNFCIYNKSVNKAGLQVNDKVTAIVLSNGQQYYIAEDNKETPTEPINYNDLSNKPKINGVELSGNKTSEDLGIETIDVIDNLESTDIDNALSANQGRILAETIDDTDTKVNNVVGVDAYDNTATYNVGDYCIYNNTLYRCITAVTSAEDFDMSKWKSTSIQDTMKQVDIFGKFTATNPSNKNVPNATNTNLGTIDIPANQTYLIIVTVSFPNNSNGFRQVGIALNANSANKDRNSITRCQASNGGETNLQLINIVAPSTNTTYYINTYQNSGSTLNGVTTGIITIRLR